MFYNLKYQVTFFDLLLIWFAITPLILQPFYSRQGDIFQFSLHKLKEKYLNLIDLFKNRKRSQNLTYFIDIGRSVYQ